MKVCLFFTKIEGKVFFKPLFIFKSPLQVHYSSAKNSKSGFPREKKILFIPIYIGTAKYTFWLIIKLIFHMMTRPNDHIQSLSLFVRPARTTLIMPVHTANRRYLQSTNRNIHTISMRVKTRSSKLQWKTKTSCFSQF